MLDYLEPLTVLYFDSFVRIAIETVNGLFHFDELFAMGAKKFATRSSHNYSFSSD